MRIQEMFKKSLFHQQQETPSLKVEVTIPLKYFSNILRSLHLVLINGKVEFNLSWKKDCVLTQHHNNTMRVNFMMTSSNHQ